MVSITDRSTYNGVSRLIASRFNIEINNLAINWLAVPIATEVLVIVNLQKMEL